MKKIRTAVVLLGLSLPVLAQATEFQPIGALGFGGAGVARNTGALTAYWNPAGGAFNDTPFAMYLGVGAGVRANNGLAENVDRLTDVNFDSINKFDSANSSSVGEMVKLLSTLEDTQKRNGNLSLSGETSVGFSIKHFSFGAFGNIEGYIQPNVDTTNILPTNIGGSATTTQVKDLYTAAVNTLPIPSTNTGYFSDSQFSTLATLFSTASGTGSNAISVDQAKQLVNAITSSSQMQGSGISASSTYSTLVNLATSMTAGSSAQALGSTFNKNNSYVTTKSIEYVEVPFAYGHPFNFGKYGKLGIGAAAKIISGNVSQNAVQLVNRPGGSDISAKDLMKDITKNNQSSVNFGVDLGAMYKYDKWLTLGVVGKNLNSPKFSGPGYTVPAYNASTNTVDPLGTKMPGEDVTLKPQVRAGVAVEPWKWLTLASDIDLTDNEVVAPGSLPGSSRANAKSRNLGGGLEVHPYSWLRVRGGAYKNLADSDVGMVVTGGVTLFLLDIDAAMATKTFKVSGTDVPQEAKVQVALSFAF